MEILVHKEQRDNMTDKDLFDGRENGKGISIHSSAKPRVKKK